MWYHLAELICKTFGLCTFAHTHTHTLGTMCEEEAKNEHDEGGLYSNPASLFLYLNHWPVAVVSHLCCVQGEWADLILDCSPVMEAGGHNMAFKKQRGPQRSQQSPRENPFCSKWALFHALSLFNTDKQHTSTAPRRANINISESCLTFICISATYALNFFVSIKIPHNITKHIILLMLSQQNQYWDGKAVIVFHLGAYSKIIVTGHVKCRKVTWC